MTQEQPQVTTNEAAKIPQETMEMVAKNETLNKELELSSAEGMFADLHAGIRGQIKKIMRPFVDLQAAHFASLERIQAQWRAQVANQINKALADMDKKLRGQYGGFIRQILIKQDQKITNAELGVKALIEETAEQLFSIVGVPNAHDEEAKAAFIKGFNESVFKRMEVLARKFVEETNKAAAEEQAQAAQKAAEMDAKAAPQSTPQEAQNGAAEAQESAAEPSQNPQ